MSSFEIFLRVYFIKYIKDFVITGTKKRFKSSVVLSEYFCAIGCRLIMTWYVGPSIREFFSKGRIKTNKGDPTHPNQIIYGRRTKKITQPVSYQNLPITDYDDPFFQQRQMEEGWNSNIAGNFYLSWFIVMYESINEWIYLFTFTRWMFFPHNPYPFGKEYHTSVCALSKIIYCVDIVEGKDQERRMGRKYFGYKGTMAGLMFWVSNPLWVTRKLVIMNRSLFIIEGLVLMV